jgi:hypothetical protein
MVKRKGNCISVVILLCFLMLLNQSACNDVLTEAQKKEHAEIKKRVQLAAVGGKHGYVVATYIIGRIKAMLLPENLVDIKVIKIKPELLEEPIKFVVADSMGYELTYEIDKERTRLKGYFGQSLKSDHFELLISKKNQGKQENDSLLKSLNIVVFELKIFQY